MDKDEMNALQDAKKDVWIFITIPHILALALGTVAQVVILMFT